MCQDAGTSDHLQPRASRPDHTDSSRQAPTPSEKMERDRPIETAMEPPGNPSVDRESACLGR